MLSFDIRSLEARAAQVDGRLEAGDAIWEEHDARPTGDGVLVQGRLSGAGQGRFYFSGHIGGAAETQCRRCLREVAAAVSEELHLLFAESGLDEAEEADVYLFPAGVRQLEMAPAVREEWLLAVPAYVLCRDDCKGLCPTCGADRNSAECQCAPVIDSRWDGLRETRNDGA